MLDHTVRPVCADIADVNAVVDAFKMSGFSSDALDAARDAAARELKQRSKGKPEAVPQFHRHLFVFGLAALRSQYTPARKLVDEVIQKSPIPVEFWKVLAFLSVYAAHRGLEATELQVKEVFVDHNLSSDWLANEPLLMINRHKVFCFVHGIFARLVLSTLCNEEFDKLLHLRPQIVSRKVLQDTWTAVAEYIGTRFTPARVQIIVRDVIIERTNTLSTFA